MSDSPEPTTATADWADFERVVEWIASTLHPEAKVTRTPRIASADTGNEVVPDIVIEYPGRLTRPVRIIGEVRARAGPQGVDWVHQVVGRMEAADASQAFLVSRDGFTEAARREARARRIAVYTFAEATTGPWSEALQPIDMHLLCPDANVNLDLLDAYSQEIFTPEAASVQKHMAMTGRLPAHLDEIARSPTPFTPDMVAIVRRAFEETRERLREVGDVAETTFLYELSRSVRVKDRAEGKRQVRRVRAQVRVRLTSTLHRMVLMRFVDGEGASKAQIMETRLCLGDAEFLVQLLTQGEGRMVPAGTQLGFRVEPLNDAARTRYGGFRVDGFADPTTTEDTVPLTLRLTLSLNS